MKIFAIGGLAAIALAVLAAGPVAAEERSFIARLMPVEGVLSPDSGAQGVATFRLGEDGTRLEFEVTAFGTDRVTQVHVHIGEGGPIAAFLLRYSLDGVVADGTLAKGVITSADLRGPFKGQPVRTLIEHMNEGSAYVNVHVRKALGPSCCATSLRGGVTATGGPDTAANPGAAHRRLPAVPPHHPS
jgi:hypothetical protein